MPRINPQDVSWDDAGGSIDPGQVSWDKTPPAGEEAEFQSWYSGISKKTGLNPDPDDPNHFYDYRAAHKAGAMPDKTGHWPSQFKREGHPRMVVDGVNTKTGEPEQSFMGKAGSTLRGIMSKIKSPFTPELEIPEQDQESYPPEYYQARRKEVAGQVGDVLKSAGKTAYQIPIHAAAGVASFPFTLPLQIATGAKALAEGRGMKGVREEQERISKAFTPPVGMEPASEEALGVMGAPFTVPRKVLGAAGKAIGGDVGEFAGEIAGDLSLIALPIGIKKVAHNYIGKGLSKNLTDLIRENNKVGLTAEESASMAESLIGQASEMKGRPLNLWEKWKAKNGFSRMGEELRAAREGGPSEPFSPEFAERVAGPKRITGPMDAFSPEMEPPGNIIGPLDPFSPELAGGIRQVRRPTLPPGQGFDLKGDPYGPPPPTIDSLRPRPGTVENLRHGSPIAMGNPTGSAHFEYEGKTWDVPLPFGNSPVGSRYGDQWALDQIKAGKAVPLGEKAPRVPRTNDLPPGQGNVPPPETILVPEADVVPGPPPGKRVKPKKPKKETDSFTQWIKNKGGIWDESLPGEMKQLGKKEGRTVALVRKKTGRSMDELAVLAVENGWLPPESTSIEFLALVNNEIRGKKAKRLGAEMTDDTDALNQFYAEQVDPSQVIWDDEPNLAPSMTPPPASGATGGPFPGPGAAPQKAGSGPPPTAPGQEPFTLFEKSKKYGGEDREIFDYDEEMNPFLRTRRLLSEEKAQREAFVKKHGETPFQVDIPGSFPGNYAIVHKSTQKPNIWQVSRFDKKGPFGHTEYETYDQALRELVDYGRADLNKIKLSRTVTLESPRWEFGGRIPFGAVEVLQPGDIKRQKADKTAQASLFGEQPKEQAQAKKKGPEVEQIGMFDQPKAEAKGPEPPKGDIGGLEKRKAELIDQVRKAKQKFQTTSAEKEIADINREIDRLTRTGKPTKYPGPPPGTSGIPKDPEEKAPGAARELRRAWDKYDGTGEFTIRDLVDEVFQIASLYPDKTGNLAAEVEKFKAELADDLELGGRGDLDAAEERFINAVKKELSVEKTAKTPEPKKEILPEPPGKGYKLEKFEGTQIGHTTPSGIRTRGVRKSSGWMVIDPDGYSRFFDNKSEGQKFIDEQTSEPVKKAEKVPEFEDMVKEAARWRSAAMNADAMLGEMYDKAHLDQKKGIKDVRFGNTRITTKGDLDGYLKKRFGIDDSTARDVSNELTKKNIPRDKNVPVEDFKGEPWADKALEVSGKEKAPEPKKADAPPKEEKKPEQLSLIKKDQEQLTLFETSKEYKRIPDKAEMIRQKDIWKWEAENYFKDHEKISSSRTTPMPPYPWKEGDWMIDDDVDLSYGHSVEKLVRLPVKDLVLTEEDYTKVNYGGRGDDARRYAGWIKEGKEPPPISVVETDSGKMNVSNGHRRVAAAKLAGKDSILAWVSPRMEVLKGPNGPIYVGMTYEGATLGPKEAEKQREARRADLMKRVEGKRTLSEDQAEYGKEPGPVWFSKMAEVLDKKLPNSGTPEGMFDAVQSYAHKGEFKPAELKWSGLDGYLFERQPFLKARLPRLK